jgi:Rhodopirellula transposase DDE domain
MNWRGRPLTSHQVVVNSIAATRTRAGLRVAAELDTASYPVGNSISRDQLAALPVRPHAQRGTWNYTIDPAASAAQADRPGHGDHDLARTQALAMLADPQLTGMAASELGALARRLAPLQAAQAEQRKYHQRGGPRRQAKADHCRPLLPDAGRVLITVIYLRQVCSQRSWPSCSRSIRPRSDRPSARPTSCCTSSRSPSRKPPCCSGIRSSCGTGWTTARPPAGCTPAAS